MNTKTRRILTIKEAAKKYLISEETIMRIVFGNCDPEGCDSA